jgi:hypothetical protein
MRKRTPPESEPSKSKPEDQECLQTSLDKKEAKAAQKKGKGSSTKRL